MQSAGFENTTKQMLEDLLGMSTGYVLDFGNDSFASFVETCLGFDPYTRYNGSKASILRQLWLHESSDDVAKLNRELLKRWELNKLRANEEPTKYEQRAMETVAAAFAEPRRPVLTPDDLDFLDRDFGAVDLSAVASELTLQQIIAARLDEIDRALGAQAPLAVILLVGSTLEGLLAEVAREQASAFTTAASAPRIKGTVKPLDKWTLSDLITVSQALGILSADVAKHADQVGSFRNYIHPRQQLKENFEPRIETARIAQQVLRAALADLKGISDRSPN